MKKTQLVPAVLIACALTACSSLAELPDSSSHVEVLDSGGRVLVEEVYINAPVSAVWDAYSTVEGWTAWVAPVGAMDFRPGGSIQSHYVEDAAIGDEGTILLNIVNFVPERLLTLRADISKGWPEVMQHDAENLMSVIIFDDLGDERTRIRVFGVGYGAAPEYDGLLGFFLEANAGLYVDLKHYLEEG